MTFEDKIIKNASIRQKKLMRPAKIAQQKPDTGVTILKKGAYFLIKDCADVTVKFLAHLAYSSYKSPIKDLKGKFNQAEIIDFVGRSKIEPETKQLLHIILTDIGTAQYRAAIGDSSAEPLEGVTTSIAPEHDYTITDGEDVYGDYSLDEMEDAPQPVNVEAKEEVNVDDVTAVINKLIEVFDAK
tara:strand:+ start:236 stop:790 length:555 start_codon:yes stop_codon:yes gene_type:complete